jgi:hypothetical protein
MPMKNPQRALSTLTREVHALYMTIQALARTHPNPTEFSLQLDQVEQMGLAALEPHPIDDAAIVGYQDTMKAIRRVLAANPRNSQN